MKTRFNFEEKNYSFCFSDENHSFGGIGACKTGIFSHMNNFVTLESFSLHTNA